MRRIGLLSALLLLSAAFAEQGLRRKRNLLDIQVESEIHHEMISPYNELVLDDFLWGGRKLMKVDGKSKSKGTMDSFSAMALKSTKSPKSTKAGLNSPRMTTVGKGLFSPKSKKKSQKTEDCYSDVFGYLLCDSSMSFMSMSVSMSMVATPTMPTNPTTPTTPTAPSTPSTPTTPTAPTTPTSPIAPTAPTSPTAPTAPTSPTAPTTPTNPTVPTQAPIDGCSSLPRDEALRTLVGAITDETTLADSTSPQGQAYQWMLDTDPASLDPCTDDNVLPRYALTTFYFSSSGASWTNSSDWLSGISECAWYGVVCSSTGTVTEIALFENNLAGTLPTELEALTDMQRLDVFDNELGGPIPNILSKWPFLAFFDVEKNQLTGSPFVDAIGLFNLQSYRVSLNAFVGGTIPADLVDKFPNLVELWLSNSTMIGSIPTEIALMDNLQSIFLYGNSLTGTLPSELGQLNLERLQVQDNMFAGRIPTELFRSTNLADLRLDTNKLAGPIPSAVGALTNLIDLRLNNNVLTGTLTTEISRLSNLVFFVLQDNQLTGTFPDAFEPFQALQFVDVSGNNLTGPLPRTVFDVPVIEILYFDDNAFTGTIPGNYANASSLRDLWLNDNQLTGTIPPTRPAELASLEEFRLDGNNLVGTVPLSLCALPSSTALTADCGGPSPAVECVCCTLCVA